MCFRCTKCNLMYYDKATHRKECKYVCIVETVSVADDTQKLVTCPWCKEEFQTVYGANNHRRSCSKKPVAKGTIDSNNETLTDQRTPDIDMPDSSDESQSVDRPRDLGLLGISLAENENDNVRRNPRRSCRMEHMDPEPVEEEHDISGHNTSATDPVLAGTEFNSKYLVEKDQMLINELETMAQKQNLPFDDLFMSNELFTSAEKGGIRLLKIMHDNRIPLCLFDKLVNAVTDAEKLDGFMFARDRMPIREKIIQSVSSKIGLDGLKPVKRKLKLNGTGTVIDLITHDFKESVYSLLSDKKLMKQENLLFPNNMNPFSDFTGDVNDINIEYYDDIDTGSDYAQAYKLYCTVKGCDYLCPIILFVDKTHTDAKGRLRLEQVTFTLGIFNRETRYHADAWRVLGYVPDQAYHTKAKNAKESMVDYHHILTEILSGLRECQEGPDMGMYWNIQKDEQAKQVLLKMPVLFVAGDSEGHDKLCSRYKGALINRLCRYCDVKTENISHPTTYHTFNMTTKEMVENAQKQGMLTTLKEMSQHNVKNAFYDLAFCNNERNIHGACPAEVTHCHQHGICPRAMETLLTMKKAPEKIRQGAKRALEKGEEGFDEKSYYQDLQTQRNKQGNECGHNKRRRTGKRVTDKSVGGSSRHNKTEGRSEEEILQDEDFVYDRASEAEISKYFVFNKQKRSILDDYAKSVGRVLQHQSDRDIPRCYFGQGISTNAMKNNHEQQGVLLLVYIALCSGLAWEWIIDMGFATYNCWVKTIQTIISFEEVLKSKRLSQSELKSVKIYIPSMMDLIKRAMNRQVGMGFNFLKAHLPLHYAEDIERFGSAENFSGGPGETRHKILAKDTAATTQRRASVFDEQCAHRLFQHLVIKRAHFWVVDIMEAKGNARKDFESNLIDEGLHRTNGSTESKPKNCGGKTYIIHRDGKVCHSSYFKYKEADWACSDTMEYVTEYVKAYIFPHINDEISELRMFTEYYGRSMDDGEENMYRAHPCFKTQEGYMEWFDWFYYDQSRVGQFIPFRLQIYLEVHGLKENSQIESTFSIGDTNYREIFSSDCVIALCNIARDPIFERNGEVIGEMISPESHLIQSGQLQTRGRRSEELRIFAVPVAKISRPCLAVPRNICVKVNENGYYPNIGAREAEKNVNGYLFLLPRKMWRTWLLKKMQVFYDAYINDPNYEASNGEI